MAGGNIFLGDSHPSRFIQLFFTSSSLTEVYDDHMVSAPLRICIAFIPLNLYIILAQRQNHAACMTRLEESVAVSAPQTKTRLAQMEGGCPVKIFGKQEKKVLTRRQKQDIIF